MTELENYPNLKEANLYPAMRGIGWGLALGTLVGVYKKRKGVVCHSAAENFCTKCPLQDDCPRPYGFREPKHNNSIPAEKIKLSIV